MRHENSVFHQLSKHIPWQVFEQLVEKHKSDHRVRRLDSKSQFLALLFGQLSGAKSLREIEAGLQSHRARLYHLGSKCAARSTLADANARRPSALFGDLFSHMATTANRTTRRKMGDAVRILDATRISLSGLSSDWARFNDDLTACKLHIVYDGNHGIPIKAQVTPDNVNDITPAKAFKIEPGATYVFDLAYYSFSWWAQLHEHGCRFVSRLKRVTKLRDMVPDKVPEGSDVLGDCTGRLAKRLPRIGINPMQARVREITVRISTGKIIRLVTNDLEAPASEIADLYKQRWQIELFFKWIKQNLKIKHFLGTSENAVRTQLYVALITFLLLRIAHAAQSAIAKPLTFRRLIRINLMHRRPLNTLNKPPMPIPKSQNQMVLELI